jgi:hypothetical protein
MNNFWTVKHFENGYMMRSQAWWGKKGGKLM